MTEWFRSWHGAPTDPKWLGIAKRSGVAPGIAVAVAWALMDRASQAADRGSIDGYDAEGLRESPIAMMAAKGHLAQGNGTAEAEEVRREKPGDRRMKMKSRPEAADSATAPRKLPH